MAPMTVTRTFISPLRRRGVRGDFLLLVLTPLLLAGRARAQDFHEHMDIWSTADGSGQLVTNYDFPNKRPPLFFSTVCVTPQQCLYTTINPAFRTAVPADDVPDDGLYPLQDGTAVTVELVAIAAGLSLNVSGKIDMAGQSAKLGSSPFHVHPSWQLVVPQGVIGDYDVSFRLSSDSPQYTTSDVYTLTLTNEQPVIPTATPAATPTPGGIAGCVGDCNGDEVVSVDELVRGVMIMLGDLPADECPKLDARMDGAVTLDEFVMAVDASLGTCAAPTFANIQDMIFTPTCATDFCHSSAVKSGKLVLEKGIAYDQLVNVAPDNPSAKMQGFLRVAPNNPNSSFLLIKLLDQINQQPILGSRMPLGLPALPPEQIDLVRKWIAHGARP